MQRTTNYNLKKPEMSDASLITDLNDNFDIIDEKMYENEQSIQENAEAIQDLTEYESGINGSISYRRRGNVVTFRVSRNYEPHSLIANQFVDVGTLPQNFRPAVDTDFWVGSMGGTARIFGRAYANGKVSLYTDSNTAYFDGTVTYIN